MTLNKDAQFEKKTDLLFQKLQEVGEFLPEQLKVPKNCTLIGSFCAKYIMFDLKMYIGGILHDTEECCNF